MNTIGILRTAVNTLLTTAESRTLGVLGATDLAVVAFFIAVTDAVQAVTTQIVEIAFNLVETIITEAFNVTGSVVDAVLGETQGEGN